MTEFKQITLIYDQFLTISTEIKNLISAEEYDLACKKMKDKDKILKKMMIARKTINLTSEELETLNKIDKKIQEENTELIENLQSKHREISTQICKTKSKVKITSAYELNTQKGKGRYIDTFE